MAKIEDYLELVPSENASKPKFMAMLGAVLQPLVDMQNMLANIPVSYDLDTAVGAQLDVLGQWIGMSRRLNVPINDVYFSFDIAGVGFDQGVWHEIGSPMASTTMLDDDTYRLFLKLKALANRWDGSLEGIQEVLSILNSESTKLYAIDNFNMTMTFKLEGESPSKLFSAVLQNAFEWMRPASVKTNFVIVT